MIICDALPSLEKSNKKSKDKGSINRSQSQRPAGPQNCRSPTLSTNSSKVIEEEAVVKADPGFSQVSLTDSKAQPETARGSNVTNTKNSCSETTSGFEDLSPSGGTSAALQPDLSPEETSSPPLIQGSDQIQTYESDGLESAPVPKPEALSESRELSEGADKGNQNSDSIYM